VKLNFRLKVTPVEFYSVLINSLADEIYQLSGDKIMPHNNFIFKKQLLTKMAKLRFVTTEIIDLVPNQKYQVKFTTDADYTILTINIKEVSNNEIAVFYEESYQADSKRVSTNFAIMNFFIVPFNKNKIKQRYRNIEKYIINNRGKETNAIGQGSV